MVTPTIDLQRRGHVARALQRFMKEQNLTVRQFNEQVLKTKPQSVVAYNWIAGRGMPGPDYIPILVEALGKDEAFFKPREPKPEREVPMIDETTTGIPLPAGVVITGVGAAALAEAEASTAPRWREPPDIVAGVKKMWGRSYDGTAAAASAQQPVTKAKAKRKSRGKVHIEPVKNSLSFLANGSGQATIKLEFTGHAESARKLFTALLDLDIGGA